MINRVMGNRRLAAVGLIVIVLVIVAVMFFMQWQTAKDEKADVENERNAAALRLNTAKVDYDIEELTKQRDNLSRGSEFPAALPAVGLSLFIAEGAYLSQVDIEIVQPPSNVGTEQIAGKNYPAYATKMNVKGSLSQIITFLMYIEGGAFSSIMVQDVMCDGTGAGWDVDYTVVIILQS
jgi:hypothetical protein